MIYLILLISWFAVGGLSSVLTYWLLRRKDTMLIKKRYNLHHFIVGAMGGYMTFFFGLLAVSKAYFDK